MNALQIKYIHNQVRLNQLQNSYLSCNSGLDDIIALMREIHNQQKQIFKEDNEILEKVFFKYKRNPELLTKEIFDGLQEMAISLATVEEQKDNVLANEIHKLLLKYAKTIGDIDLIFVESYYVGLTCFFLDFKGEDDGAYHHFKIALDYFDKYAELPRESRFFFNRCLGNCVMIVHTGRQNNPRAAFELAQKAFQFWNQKEVRSLDPNFPFDGWVAVTKRNMMGLLDVFRQGIGLEEDILYLVYSFAQELYDYEVEKNGSPTAYNIYALNAAKFHMGMISIEEMLEELDKTTTPIAESLYSQESKIRVIRNGTVYMVYLDNYSNVESKESDVFKRVEYIKNYISQIPTASFDKVIISALEEYLYFLASSSIYTWSTEMLLESIAYRHFPSHVDIELCRIVSSIIADYIINNKPMMLVGNFGMTNIDEITQKTDEIKSFIDDTCRYHGIGKIYSLDVISNYSRSFFETDFGIINQYPEIGKERLKKVGNIDNRHFDVMDNHRLDYNRSNRDSDVKIVSDLMKIVDTIVAATDHYGRPYRETKMLDKLIFELTGNGDVIYSKELLDLFKDEKLFNQVLDVVNIKRDEIITKAFDSFKLKKNNSIMTYLKNK